MSSADENLYVNEAGLLIASNVSKLKLTGQAVVCYACDFLRLGIVNEADSFFKFDTSTNWNLSLNHGNILLCKHDNVNFGEGGIYRWSYNGSCLPISTVVKPYDPFLPVYVFETLLVLFFILRAFIKRLRDRPNFSLNMRSRSTSTPGDEGNEVESTLETGRLLTSSPPPTMDNYRIKSLDVFRGITIFLMIFVNYGGGEYTLFQHSIWNGITVADVIFPWFAWIMGVSIAIKIKSQLRNIVKRSSIFYKICLRSLMLIGLGIILTNLRKDDLRNIRIPGVLQRLGISYFVVATLETVFMKPQSTILHPLYKQFEDIIESWKQWVIVILLTLAHTFITFCLPVPGCPTGYLGPGGLADHSMYSNCTGGAAGYIDRLIFTENHIYTRPTCKKFYHCDTPYDPEGLLGTLTTILCVYLGVQAGRILQLYPSSRQRILRWFLWSVFMTISAGLLCSFSGNGGLIPLNKNLWSLSYVLFCSGLAFFVLAVLYFVVDKKKWRTGSPFYQTGMNAIVLYIGHIVFKQTFPWQWKPFFTSTHTEYFIMDLWASSLWIFISIILYRYKIFISL